MKVWRTIDNFFSEEEIQNILYDEKFHNFTAQQFNFNDACWYQKKIINEIEDDFKDLSTSVIIEQWPHDAEILPLPDEHYDKDEKHFEKTGQLKFPLCSAIVYLKIENLNGAELEIAQDVVIKPETGKLVLLAPGVLHRVSRYISGKRISMNLNFWDYYL